MESCEEIKTPVLTEVGGKPRMNCLRTQSMWYMPYRFMMLQLFLNLSGSRGLIIGLG